MLLEHRVEGFDPAVARESASSGEHLVEHAPERKDVGTRVGALPAHLLRRHVADRPDHHTPLGLSELCRVVPGLPHWFCREPEVENLYLTVTGDKDVVGLEIAMNDAAIVRGGQAAANLHALLHDG